MYSIIIFFDKYMTLSLIESKEKKCQKTSISCAVLVLKNT